MTEISAEFLALHRGSEPLLLPNAWDLGSAKILVAAGFSAIATTSSGFAATLGRPDGAVTREEAIGHAAAVAAAVAVPVSADLEQGFADDPEGVADTIRSAAAAGLAGGSIEDWSGSRLYDPSAAADRIAAAVQAAGDDFVLTARAENYLHGRRDLADTIDRLQRYQQAGAQVLYAPGLSDPGEIASLVASVDRPVNVLLRPTGPTVPQLAALGVARVSVGGAFAFAALGALTEAAAQFRAGEGDFWRLVGLGGSAADSAF